MSYGFILYTKMYAHTQGVPKSMTTLHAARSFDQFKINFSLIKISNRALIVFVVHPG